MQDWKNSTVNRGVLGYDLYAVALPDGVGILTVDGNKFATVNRDNNGQ